MRGFTKALLGTSASFLVLAACGLDDTVIDGYSNDVVDGSSDGTVEASADADVADSAVDSSFADSGPDATLDAGPIADAEPDAADAADAGPDASDAAIDSGPCPTLTLCDTDASACNSGQVCVPDIPAGWTLVGFDPTVSATASACGATYAAHSAIEVTDGGATACTCACNAGAAPSCSNAQVILTTGAACTAGSVTETVSASCTNLSADYTVQNSFLQAHVQADPTTCTALLDASIPSWDGGAARECDFTGGSAAFCASHATCVAASTASHKACIKQAYSGSLPPSCATSCPTGFQASCAATASSLTDTRSCSGCSCGWSDPGCSNATVTGSDQSGCTGDATHNVTIGADTCAAFALPSVTALGVTGTPGSPSCAVTAPASSAGGVSPTGEAIVCCAN